MNVVLQSKHFAASKATGATGSADQLSQHAAASDQLKHKKSKTEEKEKETEKKSVKEAETEKGAEVPRERSASENAAGGELIEPWFGTRYTVRGSNEL